MKVVITDEAEAGLERVGDHIAIDNPGRAATFTNELINACLGLAEMPLRFSRVPGMKSGAFVGAPMAPT